MKKIARLMTLAFATFMLASCEDVPSPFGTVAAPSKGEAIVVTPSGSGTAADPYNVAGVIEATKDLASGSTTTTEYYVTGYVTNVSQYREQYNSLNYYISDDEDGLTNKFYVYSGSGLNGAAFTSKDDLPLGTKVTVCGKITNYNGTIEFQSQNKIVEWNGQKGEETTSTIGTKENPISVSDALTRINALADGGKTSEKAYVKGKVVKVTTNQANFEKFGNLNYLISDDGTEANTVTVYSGDGLDGAKFSSITDIAAGDEVIVFGNLYKYVNKTGTMTPEIDSGNYLVSLTKGTGGGETTPTGEAKGSGTLSDPYNIVAITEIASKLEQGKTSTDDYYFKGKISTIKYSFDAEHGTATFYVSDDGTKTGEFYVYGAYFLENKSWVDGNTQIKVGDEVIICGKITNYNGTLETASKKAYIYSLNGKTKDEGGSSEPSGGDTGGNSITAKATDMGFTAQAVATSYTMTDGTVLAFAKGDGSNDPKYYDGDYASVRMYAKNILTITSSKTIAKIVITTTAGNGSTKYNGNDTAYAEGSSKVTIKKNSDTEVEFSGLNASTVKIVNDQEATSGGTQLRLSSITITYAN